MCTPLEHTVLLFRHCKCALVFINQVGVLWYIQLQQQRVFRDVHPSCIHTDSEGYSAHNEGENYNAPSPEFRRLVKNSETSN
jgi:hypothetical protein